MTKTRTGGQVPGGKGGGGMRMKGDGRWMSTTTWTSFSSRMTITFLVHPRRRRIRSRWRSRRVTPRTSPTTTSTNRRRCDQPPGLLRFQIGISRCWTGRCRRAHGARRRQGGREARTTRHGTPGRRCRTERSGEDGYRDEIRHPFRPRGIAVGT